MDLNIGRLRPGSAGLAALERLETFQYAYNGRNVVSTLVCSFWMDLRPFWQVIRTTIKSWMILNFGQILSPTTALAALKCLKNQCIML